MEGKIYLYIIYLQLFVCTSVNIVSNKQYMLKVEYIYFKT